MTDAMVSNMGTLCLETILEGSDLVIEENNEKSHRRYVTAGPSLLGDTRAPPARASRRTPLGH